MWVYACLLAAILNYHISQRLNVHMYLSSVKSDVDAMETTFNLINIAHGFIQDFSWGLTGEADDPLSLLLHLPFSYRIFSWGLTGEADDLLSLLLRLPFSYRIFSWGLTGEADDTLSLLLRLPFSSLSA